MPRRGECIYKRKDGRWEARYVKEILPDGHKKYGSLYAHSYRAVKSKQLQMMQAMPVQRSSAEELCISELMYQWLAHIHNRVKMSTLQKYESITHNHIIILFPSLETSLWGVFREVFWWNLRQNG